MSRPVISLCFPGLCQAFSVPRQSLHVPPTARTRPGLNTARYTHAVRPHETKGTPTENQDFPQLPTHRASAAPPTACSAKGATQNRQGAARNANTEESVCLGKCKCHRCQNPTPSRLEGPLTASRPEVHIGGPEAHIWPQTWCVLPGSCLKLLLKIICYIQTMEYYSVIKRDE